MSNARLRAAGAIAAIAGILSACAVSKPQQTVAPGMIPGFLQGYLAPEALPDSLALLTAPSTFGTAANAADETAYRSTRSLRGTPRWDLAVTDADLRLPGAAGTFSCAVNAPITEADTPRLYQVLRRSASDAALATNAAKDHYKRPRPFMDFKEPSCTPEAESYLRRNGSFPSGHTSIGWAWALILAEVSPAQTNAVLDRGYAFGQSRVICGVHWQSDVSEGRVIAAGVVARLHADPTFTADLAAAKHELEAVRQKGLKPTRDCAAETAALAATN